MLVLARVQDDLRILPEHFDKDPKAVLTEEVDAKYANRVLQDVGLCVCLYEFEHIGEALIHPLDGSAHYKARFKLLVFRPFVGEVLTGKVLSCTEEGVRVTLGFFHDVTIPKYLLQHPSTFDAAQQTWVWEYSPDDGSEGGEEGGEDSGAKLSICRNDEVRLRVRTLKFTKIVSSAGGGRQATTTTTGAGKEEESMKEARRQRSTSVDLTDDHDPPRMSMEGSMNEDGLGLISWWDDV